MLLRPLLPGGSSEQWWRSLHPMRHPFTCDRISPTDDCRHCRLTSSRTDNRRPRIANKTRNVRQRTTRFIGASVAHRSFRPAQHPSPSLQWSGPRWEPSSCARGAYSRTARRCDPWKRTCSATAFSRRCQIPILRSSNPIWNQCRSNSGNDCNPQIDQSPTCTFPSAVSPRWWRSPPVIGARRRLPLSVLRV
jgi:hypothetical protein